MELFRGPTRVDHGLFEYIYPRSQRRRRVCKQALVGRQRRVAIGKQSTEQAEGVALGLG